MSRYKRPFKLSSLNKELTILSRAFRLAVEGGLVKRNPVRQVKYFDEAAAPFRILERDEEPVLWQALGSEPWYLLPFARLALLTGMRVGEILKLLTTDIDFRRGLLYVRDPKWKKDERRTEGLPLSAEAVRILRELCAKARGKRLFWREGDGRAHSLLGHESLPLPRDPRRLRRLEAPLFASHLRHPLG